MSNYLHLKDIVPLETPLTLMIDPTNHCNFKCTFCPTGDRDLLKSVNRPIGMMDLTLYKKILSDLREFSHKIKSIRLFKDGEPFLNKNIFEMIDLAKKANITEEVYIISNGSLLNKKAADKILDIGLDRIRFSIEHVSNEKYKKVTQTYGNYQKIVDNIAYLYQMKKKLNHPLFIDVKIVDTGLTKEEITKFKKDFVPISDDQTIEVLMGWSNSDGRDFTLDTKPETGMDGHSTLKPAMVCREPFKGMSINFDGTVSVCCVDWSHGTLIGDVNKDSVKNIWMGPRMQEFRLTHLKMKKDTIKACDGCQYIQGHKKESYLDDDAERLIPIFNELYNRGLSKNHEVKGTKNEEPTSLSQ